MSLACHGAIAKWAYEFDVAPSFTFWLVLLLPVASFRPKIKEGPKHCTKKMLKTGVLIITKQKGKELDLKHSLLKFTKKIQLPTSKYISGHEVGYMRSGKEWGDPQF